MKIRRKLWMPTSAGRVGGINRMYNRSRYTGKGIYKPPSTITKKGKNSAGGRNRKPPKDIKKDYRLTQIPGKHNIDFEMMHRIVVSMNKKKEVKAGGKTAERVKVEKGPLTHGEEMTIASEGSKTTMPNVIGQGEMVKNQNILETGSPTTKGIKMLQKLGGLVNRVLWDSKLYGAPGGQYSLIERRQLLHSHGFNTKSWWVMPGCAAPGYLDILDCILNNQLVLPGQAKSAIATYVDGRTSSISDERKYASFKDFKVEMCFTNESNYLPIKLKLYYIMPKNDVKKQNNDDTLATRSGYMWDWQNFVMNANSNYTTQRDNAIPVRYQLSSPEILGAFEVSVSSTPTAPVPVGDNYRNCSIRYQVATKANPQMSPYFRENFEVVRTFSRTLDPNDVWNFKHVHHFGAGLEVDQLKQAFMSMNQTSANAQASILRLGNDKPLVGYWLVESMGVPCTCLIGDREITASEGVVFQNPYAGTSSGSYHCEIKSSISYVGPLQNATAGGSLTSTGGASEAVHMRVFKKREFVLQDSRNVRHVLPENMVMDKDEIVADKGMITIYSDAAVQAAGNRDYKA
jgi:hypothetical protein